MGFPAFANVIGPNIAIWSACYKDSQQAQASANLQKLVAKPNEQIFAEQYHHKVSRNTLVAQLDETWQVTKEALTPWSYDLWFHHTTVTKHAPIMRGLRSQLCQSSSLILDPTMASFNNKRHVYLCTGANKGQYYICMYVQCASVNIPVLDACNYNRKSDVTITRWT